MLVESVPLFKTIVPGLHRFAMIRSSSRSIRRPERDVSVTRAGFSRVWSSATARIQNLGAGRHHFLSAHP